MMLLTDFTPDAQAEIAMAVSLASPPPRWLDLGFARIQSRAWHEWYAQRGRAPGQRRTSLPASLREAVVERDGLVCGLCRLAVLPADVHIDHILPVAHGGRHDLDNLQVAHARCNMRKGARI